ncbi:hypothetical protein F4775DRAFT_183897 [Biscogniauxia sp. FL1348]|nr:hypothetical protein F4775DRAFT_183897 [Biscogniauxia sp. FL1348]
MSASEAPVLRRPNGRPQACEPCRRRKVACDHSQPICNRCRKRRIGEDCVYLVASPARLAARRTSLPSPISSISPSVRHISLTSPHAAQGASPEGPVRQVASARRGYLGFTSYCTVYEETQNSLSQLQGSNSTCQSVARSLSHESPVEIPPRVISARTRDMCLRVLRNVPDEVSGKVFFRGRPFEAWVYYFAQGVLDSFYDAFGHYFDASRSDAKLEELVGIICANTIRPFSDEESDPRLWLGQFSGKRTRWETLGMFFIFWSFNTISVTRRGAENQDEYGHESRLVERECLGLCIDLCKEFSCCNTLLLFMCYRRSLVESMVSGDASIRAWTYHAEAVAMLTFLGYHVSDNDKPYQPTLSSEIKRRMYHQIYTTDMVIVSFTGRPPLLGRRFASTPLPLDIKNDDLFADRETFVKATARLDERGWNTDGVVYSCSPMRGRATIAAIREELFELALGQGQAISVEALLELRERELRAISEFPEQLFYRAEHLEDPTVEVGVLYARLLLKLEHLQNMFFVERLLLRHGHNQSDLLAVSFDLVSFTLPFWTHFDRLAAVRADCEWLVMAYAVPAGGILCLELLKPTLHNNPPHGRDITRSGIIQKLSLLVGFLDWIRPTAPNGDLCGNCKSIIKHVLDQALNASSAGYESTGAFDWDFSTQVDFDFDLLDTFDWTRPDFSVSQQSHT